MLNSLITKITAAQLIISSAKQRLHTLCFIQLSVSRIMQNVLMTY